ncbi:MAG TPA: pitrilysin family protein [bacterium]|nr:pitrilysin family protein [bacterium]
MPSKSIPAPGAVTRFKFKNGATLLVKEEPNTPVVALNFWVEAGSVDERPDERGMAHLIEHMIFKGTRKRGVGEISRQVEAAGGYLNAFTSYEHTCFYVVLPSEQVQKAIDIEFDAYQHSLFDAKELAKEKEVVFEEMRMRRDDPWSWSWEILLGMLFRKNPYHWPVIGDLKILRAVPRERLKRYYDHHYVPANMVISVVGNVEASKVQRWVAAQWGRKGKVLPPVRRTASDNEPAGLKLRLEEGEVQQIYLSVGFPTVALEHPDSAPLEILAALLGDGASSRFNLSLRERTQDADDVASEHFSGKYGGALVFQALTDSSRLENCVSGIGAEIDRLLEGPLPPQELEKVKNRIKSSKVFEKQNVDGQAKTLGFWELQGGYEKEEAFLRALDAVSEKDITRVGRRYLTAVRASLLIYHPKGQAPKGDRAHWEGVLEKALSPKNRPRKAVKRSPDGPAKIVLRNGETLWFRRRKSLPLVSLGAFVPGGFSEERPEVYGITSLMTKCLLKGTSRLSHDIFSHRIESLGAHLDASMDKDYWGLTLDCLVPQFERAYELFRETLRDPAFLPSETAKERKMQMAAVARLKDDPAEYALLQSDLLTFQGTPYAHAPLGEPETLSKIGSVAMRDWHHRFIKKKPLTWFAVGDMEPEKLLKLLETDPRGRRKPGRPGRDGGHHDVASRTLRFRQGTQQSNLVLGLSAPSFRSDDYFPFRVLNTLLNGMGGRLFLELREKRSLAYSVYASHDAGARAGIYQIYIGCDPSKADSARAEMERVLFDLWTGRITQAELERAKTYMAGLFKMGLQSNRSQLLSYARYEMAGHGAGTLALVPGKIQKVTLKDVRRVAEKYLDTDKKTWVLVTPQGRD